MSGRGRTGEQDRAGRAGGGGSGNTSLSLSISSTLHAGNMGGRLGFLFWKLSDRLGRHASSPLPFSLGLPPFCIPCHPSPVVPPLPPSFARKGHYGTTDLHACCVGACCAHETDGRRGRTHYTRMARHPAGMAKAGQEKRRAAGDKTSPPGPGLEELHTLPAASYSWPPPTPFQFTPFLASAFPPSLSPLSFCCKNFGILHLHIMVVIMVMNNGDNNKR